MIHQLAGDDQLSNGSFCGRVVAYLEEGLPPQELQVLNVELRAEASKRDAFVQLCMVRSTLIRQGVAARSSQESEAHAGRTLADTMVLPAIRADEGDRAIDAVGDSADSPRAKTPGKSAPAVPVRTGKLRRYAPWLAVAATVVLASGLVWLTRGGRFRGGPADRPSLVVATITAAPVGGANDGPVPLVLGAAVTNGQRIRLATGVIELTFDTGATVLVQAPADVTVVDRGTLALDNGAIYAHVPPPARGFCVNAPGLSIVDRGTNFGVRTGSTGKAAEVHVIDGLVEATTLDAAGRQMAAAVPVTAGHAVSHVAEGTADVIPIPFAPAAFAQGVSGVRLTIAAHSTGAGLGGGNPDPNWQIVSMPGQAAGQSSPAFVLSGLKDEWVANLPDARWISPTAGPVDARSGEYVYSTTLDLTGFDPTSASVRARMAVDDKVASIRINGTRTDLPTLRQVSWKSMTEVNFAAVPWRAGPNRVEVTVVNGGTGYPNPTGLLCRWTVTATALLRR